MRYTNQIPPFRPGPLPDNMLLDLPVNMRIVSLREPPAPRTCDQLGVCPHPAECTGRSCYRDIVTPSEAGNDWPDIAPSKITEPDERAQPRETPPVIDEPFSEFTFWLLCFMGYAAIFAILGYLWGRHGDKIKAALASLWA